LDQADDPPIADPVLDEADQPVMADRVKEPGDVGIEDPADLACLDPVGERIQRIVLAAPGTEPIAEPQELRCIDRGENGHHRHLDDLVLQGGDAERPLPAIGLRDVPSPRGLRSIRSAVNMRVQISEVSLEVCRVLFPRRAVCPWRGVLLQAEERPSQVVDANVVQERCQLLFPVPADGFT
jgi:hypothetical protein